MTFLSYYNVGYFIQRSGQWKACVIRIHKVFPYSGILCTSATMDGTLQPFTGKLALSIVLFYLFFVCRSIMSVRTHQTSSWLFHPGIFVRRIVSVTALVIEQTEGRLEWQWKRYNLTYRAGVFNRKVLGRIANFFFDPQQQCKFVLSLYFRFAHFFLWMWDV